MNFAIVTVLIITVSGAPTVTNTPFTGAPEWCIRAAHDYDQTVHAHTQQIEVISACRATDEQSAKALEDYQTGHLTNGY